MGSFYCSTYYSFYWWNAANGSDMQDWSLILIVVYLSAYLNIVFKTWTPQHKTVKMEYEHTVNRCAFVLSSECIFRYLGQCYHVSLQDAVICNPEPLTKTGGKIFVVFFKYTTLMFLKKCFSSLLLFSCDTKLHQSSTVKSLLHSTYEVVLLKIETKMVGLCYLYPHVV